MAEVDYDGTKRSAADLTYALSAAGYRVAAMTPNTPRAATAFWLRARELFEPTTVEQGTPRDYRALIEDSHQGTQLVHVAQNGVLRIDDEGRVTVTAPQTPVSPAGLRVWQSNETGQTHDVFIWDSSDLGFVDLIAFFQLNGNLLNRLTPSPDVDGFPFLQGAATHLASGQVYQFDMTRGSRFTTGSLRTIQTLTQDQLLAGHRLVR